MRWSWRRSIMLRLRLLTKLLVVGVLLVVGAVFYFALEWMPEARVKAGSVLPFLATDTVVRTMSGGQLKVERVAEYCNVPGQVMEGQEGEAPEEYDLTSVYIVIRHGDRTPMSSFLNIPPPAPSQGCTMDTYILHMIPELRHFVRDMEAQKRRQRSQGDFANWSLYPQHSTCSSSQLTGRGALQHLFNGLSLRRKYQSRWGLLQPPFFSPSAHLVVHSTMTSRTYQSAIALLYGLLPHFNLSELHIQAALNMMFCRASLVPAACCANLAKLKQEAEQVVRLHREEDSAWYAAIPPLARVFGVKVSRLPGPSQLIDILQGHACHNLPLPCGKEEGHCVTLSMLGKLWALVDGTGNRRSQEVTFDRYCRTVMQSLLKEMLNSMQKVARNHSAVRFTLYSGHDLTLTPLLQTLGLYKGKWPQYATRLVWELYSKRSAPGKHYLRIVHNGADVTAQVRFCQGRTVEGMCALKHFEDFVILHNMDAIGVNNTHALQSFCQSKVS